MSYKRFPPHWNSVSTLPCETQTSCYMQSNAVNAFFKFEMECMPKRTKNLRDTEN